MAAPEDRVEGPPAPRRGGALGRLRQSRHALVGSVLVGGLFLLGALAPLVAPHDPLRQDLDHRLAAGLWAGNLAHPLGTDELGRDILSRIVYGARITLVVGFISLVIMNGLGIVLGIAAGYLGGWVDAAVTRLLDVLLAFPYIILAIAIMAVLGQGVINAVIAISIVYTPTLARIVRSVALQLRERQFVEAARALGGGTVRILRRHVLPNAVPQVIVFSALSLGETILYIAALGFLGLGIAPPTPEWGAMVSTGKDRLILGQWWPSAFPGLSIMLASLGFVLLGDGLRDVLDPRLRS